MGDQLALLNAVLNATAFVLLLLGRAAIRRGDRALHKKRMLGAVAISVLFLVSYLTRMAIAGVHHFPDVGVLRLVYLAILATHTVLAALTLPGVLALLVLAWRERFGAHRRLARWVWPSWVYVSATGVVVYLMLYQVAPRLVP